MKIEKKGRKKVLIHKNWWDKSCTRKKKLVQRMYGKWRKRRLNRERYLEEKKKYMEYLKEKKKKKKRRLRNIKK